MMELLALLLPIAAASGWWAAKRSVRKEQLRLHAPEMDSAYFRGLNYLVNEQPDKAIDVFVRMLEVNSETVEMHLALGSLFRRRGEVDRAIRVHQNLIARPTLSSEQRFQALLELGRDYMKAGLLDRAEGLFAELVENRAMLIPALENLKVIYQHEKDWQKALEISQQLEELDNKELDKDHAHFLCEMAEEQCAEGDSEKADTLLVEALKIDTKAMRPRMMQAEIAVEKRECDSAISLYKELAEIHPAYIGEFVERMADCFRRIGRDDEWMEWLESFYQRRRNQHIMLAIAEEINEQQDADAAIAFLNKELATMPTLAGVHRLIALRMGQQPNQQIQFLVMIDELIAQMISKQSAYQCHRCGFTSRTLHWQCPGCRGWGTLLPTTENNGRPNE